MTKIFKTNALMDSQNQLWIFNDGLVINVGADIFNCFPCISVNDGIEKLKKHGYIKTDPLKDTLEEIRNRSKTLAYPKYILCTDARTIVRKLAEELTEEKNIV